MTARNLARAGLVVTAAFLASRVLGWVRLIVIGNLFGAQADLDAYFAAFRIPDLIYQLVAAGALASALVPMLSGLLQAGQESRAWRMTSTVANLMLVSLLIISTLMAVFAPLIMPFLVPGFDVVNTELTIRLTRIMLLAPIFLALGAVASSVLNSQGRFGAAAIAPIVYNIAIIAAALLLSPLLGIDALAIGVVIGAFAHLAVQLPSLRGRFHYELIIDRHDADARQTLWLMAPRAIALGAVQVTYAVNTTLSTGLGVGAVVAYSVAFTILQIPLGVVSFPLGVVLLPAMSRAFASGQMREFGYLVQQSLRLLLYVSFFVTTVGIVLRSQTVFVLFGGGFDEDALAMTGAALGVFLLGIPAHSMNVVLARAFYSGKDTRTPVAIALFSVGINIVVSVLTVGSLGLQGLALGIAVGGWVEAVILLVLLWRRTRTIQLGSIVLGGAVFAFGSVLAAFGAAAVVMYGTPVFGTDPGRLLTLLQMVVATLAAGVIYMLYSRLMRVPELPRTFGLMRSALRRG